MGAWHPETKPDEQTRRAWCARVLSAGAGLVLASCERPSTRFSGKSVTLYSSADDAILRAIVKEFESRTEIKVAIVTDTEATKTTGLVQRLIDEKDHPKADVWWSSEPLGTIRLAREGVLEPLAEKSIPEGWPANMIGKDRLWVGFAQRARVIAYTTVNLPPDGEPKTLRALVHPSRKGRVGIARPQFGTTRTQMACLLAEHGSDRFRAWLQGLKANEVRLFDGNATVVKAITYREIDAGLTDSDDVRSAKRNAWNIGSSYEWRDTASEPVSDNELPSRGSLLMPNTVAMVHRPGRESDTPARLLVEFLLSANAERLLAESESGNIPVNPSLADKFSNLRVPDAWQPDFEAAADVTEDAVKMCVDILGA